jgi:hypothetical protein
MQHVEGSAELDLDQRGSSSNFLERLPNLFVATDIKRITSHSFQSPEKSKQSLFLRIKCKFSLGGLEVIRFAKHKKEVPQSYPSFRI